MRSKIAIVGVGGTGSHLAEMAVRLGFGHVILIDDDVVELSNLNRQSLYDEEDVGKYKVEAAYAKLSRINSEIEIIPIRERVNRENADKILRESDVIMDGTDSYSSRSILNEYSVREGKLFIFSAVEGHSGMIKMIVPHKTACLSCFGYPNKGDSVPCSIHGLLPTTVEFAASVAMSLALKGLMGEIDEYLYVFDIWNPELTRLSVKLNPYCEVCGMKK